VLSLPLAPFVPPSRSGSSYMFWKSIRATNFIFNLAAALFVVAEVRRATAARQLIKNVCSSSKKELK